ncbi:GCN5 family acetyltransferase [Paenibacillus pectinilyticus]|uniref:GCN5 family acetyltransferase n=1 Tax=Paenibacillus pectinilyticus TaxID=512399 RepID=A0A1C1A026_9BACL|nr:GNAT family N-acetyltransferase [Paenibacillus pectinilyticus]OCT13641.1 GCN5 family acetyltransferase [Paenibacillus pectinilyticus]
MNALSQFEDKYLEEIIELILYVQNYEFQLDISIDEQSDILDIQTNYIHDGGNFWVALNEKRRVIGTIGLQKKTDEIFILKKFFVYIEYRGGEFAVGQKLFEVLLEYAKQQGATTIFLDSPSIATRSHHFYEKNGFKVITKEELPIPYGYPDRNSYLYRLDLLGSA